MRYEVGKEVPFVSCMVCRGQKLLGVCMPLWSVHLRDDIVTIRSWRRCCGCMLLVLYMHLMQCKYIFGDLFGMYPYIVFSFVIYLLVFMILYVYVFYIYLNSTCLEIISSSYDTALCIHLSWSFHLFFMLHAKLLLCKLSFYL